MSRQARESSRHLFWHLSAFVMVIAGLSVLAPMVWWKSQRDRPEARPNDSFSPPPQLTIAPLRPPVAEQIDLDPSITETPLLPSGPPPADNQLSADASGELSLNTTASRTLELNLPNPQDAELLEQPLAGVSDSQLEREIPATKAWPYPSALVEQLNILAAAAPQVADWTTRVRVELERLILTESLADPAAGSPLANLQRLAEEGKTLALSLQDSAIRAKLLRAGFAIARRLAIWDRVRALAARGDMAAAPVVDRSDWERALGDVDALLHSTGPAANWRNYLLIDRARDDFDSPACTPADQRQLARDILHRMHSTQLSYEQQQFVKTPPLAALAKQLRARVAETPDFMNLLTAIERHEFEDRSRHARALALEYEILRWSPDPEIGDLAETVNTYYRNANVRVALSAELFNRMLPPRTPQVEPVEDVIVGALVWGEVQSNTRLRVVLVPDPHRWNIGLEAAGEVASDTTSTKGPATFYQSGHSVFRARKRLIVDRRGIRLFSSEAEANANNELSDYETDFDGIPLLGGIARAIAKNQYDAAQPMAKAEVEGRIVGRATSQLDREVAQKLEQAKRDLQLKMFEPLRQLNLEPAAVDLETTSERVIARYRVAARDQISAHTPRPQAPGDSVLSVQIHETALNNVLDKLNLHGRRVELRELHREMTTRFNREALPVPEDLPQDVHVTFADEDPVRLDCQDGRVRLTIRLKELTEGTRNRWTNFTVRGYYAPNADQLDANLVREGIIELIGDREHIRLGDQITLRGIFARVLSRNRKLNVINKQIAGSPELRDQQVTQFVIHDGWIGVALGPKTASRQAAMHARPRLSGSADEPIRSSSIRMPSLHAAN
jgi:hypothetical protein